MENDLLENIILQQDNLSEDQIQLILTNYYRDDRVSGLIEKLGYEKLKNHIPRLIELSQNYGVASRNAIKVLQDGGKDVLPFIQRAVRASKWDTWGWFWFLCALLDGCSHELAEGLKSHILDGCSRVAQSDDVIETLAMLSKNQVLTEQELLSYFQSLQPCFVINLSPLDLYSNNFKNWFWATRKLSEFVDFKSPNIRNMRPLKIGKLRCFGAAENPIFEVV